MSHQYTHERGPKPRSFNTIAIVAWSVVLATAIFGACGSNPTTFSPNNTDEFTNYNGDFYDQADKVIAADYLFSLDTSASMRTYQQSLVNTIANHFMSDLDANRVDYRIGLVEGTYQNGYKNSNFGMNFLGSTYISASNNNDIISSALSYLGQNLNPNVPNLLDASKILMANQGSGFTRLGAQLVYIFVTDCTRDSGDDESSGTAASYANALKAMKADATYVSARSIIDTSKCPKLKNATKLLNAASDPTKTGANNTGSYSIGNKSSSAIASSLASLAQDVTKNPDRFQLRGRPVKGTLYVSKGMRGTTLQNVTTGWTYYPATNEVVFTSASKPDAGESVKFSYQVDFVLSQAANSDSINVTVDGNAVSQSAADGWTYDGGSNRILFHGSSYPRDDAKVSVTYEVL